MKKIIVILIVLAVITAVSCSESSPIENSISTEEDNDYNSSHAVYVDTKMPNVYFDTAMASNGTELTFDSSPVYEEPVFVDSELVGTERIFNIGDKEYTYAYARTWNVNYLSEPVKEYELIENDNCVAFIEISDSFPEYYNWGTSVYDGFSGSFDDESLAFALSAISEKYGEDVSQYELYFDNENGKSVIVYKTVDGLTFTVGKCCVCETENGYETWRLLVMPKSLQDKFHLKYTVEEIKGIVENRLAEQYPGARVDSVSIGDGKYSSWYDYLTAKNTWAYSFFANVTVLNEDGEEVTASVGCYIPFELDE